jgi:hypothetical protein
MANEQELAQHGNWSLWLWCVVWRRIANKGVNISLLEQSTSEGESPCRLFAIPCTRHAVWESRSSELERKVGGKLHLMLRMCSRPIAHKYHEGKMKRTLERELKVTELAEWEADGSSGVKQICQVLCCSSAASMQMAQYCERCQAWSFLLCLSMTILCRGIVWQYATLPLGRSWFAA